MGIFSVSVAWPIVIILTLWLNENIFYGLVLNHMVSQNLHEKYLALELLKHTRLPNYLSYKL